MGEDVTVLYSLRLSRIHVLFSVSLILAFSHAVRRYTVILFSQRVSCRTRRFSQRASFVVASRSTWGTARHNFIACYSRDVPRLFRSSAHTHTHARMHAHTHTYVRITHCASHVALTSNQLHRLLLSRRASPLRSSARTRTHACMLVLSSHVALTSNQLHRLLLSRRASPLQSSPVPSSRARVTYTTHRSHTHVTLLHLVSEVRFTNLDNRQSQSQSRSHVVVNLTHGNGNHHVAATSAVNRPITRRIVVITDAGQFHRREAGT